MKLRTRRRGIITFNTIKLSLYTVTENFGDCFFVNSKKYRTFASLCTWCGLYTLKVFSLSYKKMWKFSRTKDKRNTLTTCLFIAGNTLISNQCVLSLYLSGVRISIVYFRSGFSTTFLLISVAILTLFLYISIPNCKEGVC